MLQTEMTVSVVLVLASSTSRSSKFSVTNGNDCFSGISLYIYIYSASLQYLSSYFK